MLIPYATAGSSMSYKSSQFSNWQKPSPYSREHSTYGFNHISILKFANEFHAEMRVPVVEYITLALSSSSALDSGYSASGPPSVEVVPLGVKVNGPNCWAPSNGVSANYGPLSDL